MLMIHFIAVSQDLVLLLHVSALQPIIMGPPLVPLYPAWENGSDAPHPCAAHMMHPS